MNKFLRTLSYIIAVLTGAAMALAAVYCLNPPISKLDQLENLIANRFIGEYDQTGLEDAAAHAMIGSLGDQWSYYIPASQYAAHVEQMENAYVGIGITISPTEDNSGYLIIAVTKNSPAEETGLLVGDKVISAEGQDVTALTTEELRNIVRGKEGTTVHLSVLREDETLEFDVKRASILTDVVLYQMLEGDIGLIQIANFDNRCASESIAAIETLREQGAKALIFDVRFNPGGYAHELVALLDYLLPEGDLFRTVDYAGNESVDRSDADYLDMPIAVLCNQDSYSAAEFFAAAIQEYEAGVIIGEQTCGKGYFQATFPLLDGSAVGLSIGKYYTPNGTSLADVGVTPDIVVEVDDETYANLYYGLVEAADDPQIQAAIDALK